MHKLLYAQSTKTYYLDDFKHPIDKRRCIVPLLNDAESKDISKEYVSQAKKWRKEVNSIKDLFN
jgi:hypothetical protein